MMRPWEVPLIVLVTQQAVLTNLMSEKCFRHSQFSSTWRQSFLKQKIKMSQNRHFWVMSLEKQTSWILYCSMSFLIVVYLWCYLPFLHIMFMLWICILFFFNSFSYNNFKRVIVYEMKTIYFYNVFEMN